MASSQRRILVLNGHPDAGAGHYDDALVEAYAEGARSSGHDVQVEVLHELDIPLLRSRQAWTDGPVPEGARRLQQALADADHLVLVFPLWLGGMPAMVKSALEQTLRPGFALAYEGDFPGPLLKGRSARVIATMGMPGLFYRWFYRAHSLKSLKRNILEFCGIKPVRLTTIGLVEGKPTHRKRWLDRVTEMGRTGR